MSDALASFVPFERVETLGTRVREQLRRAIMVGLFKPGEKLTLRAIASALGVSLTPAREALLNLGADGTLDIGPKGSIHIPVLDREKLRELLKVRLSLESLAAREAIHKLTSEDIIEISAINDQLIEANQAKNYRELIDLNWSFHFTIYNAAQMPFLVRMIESCWLRAGSYLNVIYPDFASSDKGILNHIAILRAIREHDADALANALMHDIETSAEALYAQLES
ncbi:GntR family transcriptional regulator [Acetobacter sp. TBRC 12305]|uniref:GntR family transcriptional regulator n=1 Tax=Acetobacter garciniae TaxID=2817435 RepID=A0A939HM75_9PROT|nr:GntR family transcriptional regulator [Acetobacter garciniae]MBO1326102.1 GntR family transcriptional regulator [Acetobacter garciniae]MBX0345153.1 GntR family transcriptional regulator [Acetobacter garciniae]